MKLSTKRIIVSKEPSFFAEFIASDRDSRESGTVFLRRFNSRCSKNDTHVDKIFLIFEE